MKAAVLIGGAFLLVALGAAGSCQSGGRADLPERPWPNAAALLEAHNARVERLARVYSRGVIELNWTDEDGRHREQGDLDLYLELPRKTAFRVSKVGETYFWFGSDAERFWVFDLSDDSRRTLRVDEHGRAVALEEATLVPPLALLDLMGLSKLVPLPDDEVGYDRERDAWIVTGRGQGGVVRLFIDRQRGLPSRVELRDTATDVPRISSRIFMDRYRFVPLSGRPQSAWPRMATNVDIIASDTGDGPWGFLKIALGEPTTIVEEDAFDRVFDLDRLIRAHRPHVVESGGEDVTAQP